MIFKIFGVLSALAMIMITLVVIATKFQEYGFGLPFFFVSFLATLSLLAFGSTVVILSFYLDSEFGNKTGRKE